MRHFIICFLLVYLSIPIRAQLATFPTPGLAYGAIYVCNPFDCPGYGYYNMSMVFVGTENLCGQEWNKFDDILGGDTYIQEENGKYYHFISCAYKELMYDFTKNTGDTVLTDDLGPLLVTSVGQYTLFNGSVRKKMTLIELTNPFSPVYTWVDGIGDIERGFFRYSDFEGGHSQLVCMRDSTGIFYHTSGLNWPLDCDSLLCKPPSAVFDYDCSGQTVTFINQSANAATYNWDFGDGITSTETNPSHTYSAPGCYDVVLKVKSPCLPQFYTTQKKLTINTPHYWKQTDPPLLSLFKVQFPDSLHGWGLGDKKIWKTIDGGQSWDTVPFPGPARALSHMSFSDSEHGIVAIRIVGSPYYDEILWTDNGGNDWVTFQIADAATITAIERLDESSALVAGHYQGIFATKDHGQTWTQQYVPASLIADFVPVGGENVYFAGIQQITFPFNKMRFGKTSDLLNWETFAYGDSLLSSGQINFDFTNDQNGWITANNRVLHTTDGGLTWQPHPDLFGRLHLIDFGDAMHGWVAGYDGIYGTSDGGITWQQQACTFSGKAVRSLNAVSANIARVITQELGLCIYTSTPDTLTICSTITATAETDSNFSVSMHPNPVSTSFYLKGDGCLLFDLEMYNLQGEIKIRRTVAANEPISVAGFAPGIYLLRISVGGKMLGPAQKVVVVRA